MRPHFVDASIDLAYGVLLFVAVVLIVWVGTAIGLAFGFGVLVSYALHVVWKMGRFEPDWMATTVEETVEQTVEETVKEQVETVQEQVEEVEQRVERRPREDEVAELIEATVTGDEDDLEQ